MFDNNSVSDDSRDMMTAYLNGAPVAALTNPAPVIAHTSGVGIGAMNNGTNFVTGPDASGGSGYYFNGVIDDVALYNGRLSAQQVQSHYAAGSGDRLGLSRGVTLGTSLNFAAEGTNNINSRWSDTIGTPDAAGNSGSFNWSLSGAARVGPLAPDPNHAAINYAYAFNGSAAGSAAGFTSIPGDPTTRNASFEIWVKPTSFTGQHMIFETGDGSDGTAMCLSGSTVAFTVGNGGTAGLISTSSFDLSRLSGIQQNDFVQLVGVVDLKHQLTLLYVNGVLRDQEGTTGPGTTFADWASSDGSGLGNVNGAAIAGGLDAFRGNIAAFRFYDDTLAPQDILTNYEAMVPRTSTYYWDPNNTGSSNGGGAGTWNSQTWWEGSNVAWLQGKNANFGGPTGGTVTLTGPLDANNLAFAQTGYTLSGRHADAHRRHHHRQSERHHPVGHRRQRWSDAGRQRDADPLRHQHLHRHDEHSQRRDPAGLHAGRRPGEQHHQQQLPSGPGRQPLAQRRHGCPRANLQRHEPEPGL